MDSLQRDFLLAGLTDDELRDVIALELRRRRLLGCFFAFPEAGGRGWFCSSAPPGLLADMTTAQQLLLFAEVAAQSPSEVSRNAPEVKSLDQKYTVN